MEKNQKYEIRNINQGGITYHDQDLYILPENNNYGKNKQINSIQYTGRNLDKVTEFVVAAGAQVKYSRIDGCNYLDKPGSFQSIMIGDWVVSEGVLHVVTDSEYSNYYEAATAPPHTPTTSSNGQLNEQQIETVLDWMTIHAGTTDFFSYLIKFREDFSKYLQTKENTHPYHPNSTAYQNFLNLNTLILDKI